MMTRKHAGICLATMMLTAAALGGCNDHQDAMAEAPVVSAPELGARAKGEAGEADGLQRDMAPHQRKLIQTGEMRLDVADYGDARAAIDQELKRVGGFVADADVRHNDGRVSKATLTLRIPQAHFHSFLRGAAERGTVVHEQLHSADITDVYVDTEARLKNARRLEARMIQLLDNKTDGVKDLLEVERELARVREQIERHEGRLKQYDKQVGLSTLKLELMARQPYLAATPVTLGERVANTFNASLTSMGSFGRGLLLMVVALVPWLLPLLFVGWLAYRGVRWLGRKGRLAREAGRSTAATANVHVGSPPLG